MRFWDSSAIIPLLVEEPTTGSMTAYYQAQPEMVAWWSSTLECASALARLEREGHLDTASATQAFVQLQSLHATWNEIQPLDIVRATAQRLVRVHPLRAANRFSSELLWLPAITGRRPGSSCVSMRAYAPRRNARDSE